MGRAKVNMELITKEKNRKTTYKNRKDGIIKKAKELSVLCDVNTAIIIYDYSSNNPPEIWPENPDQIKKTIASYKDVKKNENGKRVMYDDVKDYFQSRKRKIEDELVRTRERNMEAIYPTWFQDLNSLSERQLRQFASGLEAKERIVKAHLEVLKKTRNVNVVEKENNRQSSNDHYVNLDQVQPLNADLMSHELGWFNDAPNVEMSFGSGLKNNQPEPANNNVGSDPSVDQVQAIDDDDLISVDLGWFYDIEDLPFEFKNIQPANHNVGSVDDQVKAFNHDSMMSHDLGCLECAPTDTSFTVQKPAEKGVGFDYPDLEDDGVHDNSKPLAIDQPVEQSQCGFENNQPANHNVESVDQVQASNYHDLMRRIIARLIDAPNAQMPFEFKNNQPPANHNVDSVDQVQNDSMMSNDLGCLECAPSGTWFTPQKPAEMGIGFDYPALEDDVVYDNSMQCCPMAPQELALQEDSHVNAGGVEEDDDLLEFLMTLG